MPVRVTSSPRRTLITALLVVAAGCDRGVDDPSDPAPAGDAAEIAFDRYHSQAEIGAYLRALGARHPGLVSFHSLGSSQLGRDLPYATLDATGHPGAPTILLNGTHHGDEWASTESVLGVAAYLVANRDAPGVKELLARYRIVLLPLVNPDGHAAGTREDAQGRDPNRDYAYPLRSEAESFHVPEIALLRGLQDQARFRAAIAYHAGMTGVLWPWAYDGLRARDLLAFRTLSRTATQAMGFSLFAQSFDDFQSTGEYLDYAYMKHDTLAVTFEVSEEKTPPDGELAAVVAGAVRGTLAYLDAVRRLDEGTLVLDADAASEFGVLGPRWSRADAPLE